MLNQLTNLLSKIFKKKSSKNLLLSDLSNGKYYCLHNKQDNIKYYIKYKYHTLDHVFSYGVQLRQKPYGKPELIYYNPSITKADVCSTNTILKWIITEISFDVIADCLPDDFIDKINYIRQQKIYFLLKN